MIFTWSLLKAWVMKDTGSVQGNRRETGGSRRNYSMHGLITHLTSCPMDTWVRYKGKKMFWVLFFFLPCYKASVPPWRPGSWLVASPLLLLPVSSPGHTLPRQNLSLNQDLYVRLFSFWAFLPRATQHWFSLLVQSSQLCSFSLCDTGD